jgi:hypothetical protein
VYKLNTNVVYAEKLQKEKSTAAEFVKNIQEFPGSTITL